MIGKKIRYIDNKLRKSWKCYLCLRKSISDFWNNKKEWFNAKDLKKGDYLAIPLNKENKIPEILTKNKVNQHFTKSQLIKLDKKE